MINIIPRPSFSKETEEKIWFSKKTIISGVFSQVTTLFENLIPESKDADQNNLTFIFDEDIIEEGYKILYSNGDINVFCSSESGALYAFMTLVQLAAGNDYFNAVIIDDAPKYSWRGFMLDCSRHFWTVEKIKKILDYMASIKMNVFHWHLADDQGWRIEIKKYPLLTEKGSIRKGTQFSVVHRYYEGYTYDKGEYGRGLFYTQDDAREIVAYAAERNIMVIPEIDVPGHATAAIACYPEISCSGKPVEVEPHFGIFKNNLCCAKDAAYKFIKTVIDELCEIFPAPYFHIGGDEVESEAWDNCPDCQALMKKEGLEDHVALHGYFNNILIEHLRKHGKRVIGWNDMLNPNLDKTSIGQLWTFERGLKESLDWVNHQGGDVIISSQVYLYADYPYSRLSLPATYNFNATFLGIEREEGILGYEMPLWTEYVEDELKFGFHTHVRFLALSELCWTNPKIRNYENFEQRVEKMRSYFEAKGMIIPPRKIYNGYSFDGAENQTYFDRRMTGFNEHWFTDVDYEYNLFKDLTK